MSFVFRPATRENTPLIIGLAGPTKGGKTYSALRLAVGLADGGMIAMLNAEGKRGEQYADTFTYVNANISAPYSPERYTEALMEMATMKPAVGIIDSASHMHDGPGGLLEYHDTELDRIAGKDDSKKRERCTWTAWIRPKAAENKFIYTMLAMECPIILCFRAKEKLKIVTGQEPIDLGWQPIAGDRITFETSFTLMLPPRSKGVPDLSLSELRQPFDEMIPANRPIDEQLGRKLREWAKGGTAGSPTDGDERGPVCMAIQRLLVEKWPGSTKVAGEAKASFLETIFKTRSWTNVQKLPLDELRSGLETMRDLLIPEIPV